MSIAILLFYTPNNNIMSQETFEKGSEIVIPDTGNIRLYYHIYSWYFSGWGCANFIIFGVQFHAQKFKTHSTVYYV